MVSTHSRCLKPLNVGSTIGTTAHYGVAACRPQFVHWCLAAAAIKSCSCFKVTPVGAGFWSRPSREAFAVWAWIIRTFYYLASTIRPRQRQSLKARQDSKNRAWFDVLPFPPTKGLHFSSTHRLRVTTYFTFGTVRHTRAPNGMCFRYCRRSAVRELLHTRRLAGVSCWIPRACQR